LNEALRQLAAGHHGRPHDLLGRQPLATGERIVAWRPDAVAARFAPEGPALEPTGVDGVFAWEGTGETIARPHAIEWHFPNGGYHTTVDFAAFPLEIEEAERRAFHEGHHTSAWRMLGARAPSMRQALVWWPSWNARRSASSISSGKAAKSTVV